MQDKSFFGSNGLHITKIANHFIPAVMKKLKDVVRKKLPSIVFSLWCRPFVDSQESTKQSALHRHS